MNFEKARPFRHAFRTRDLEKERGEHYRWGEYKDIEAKRYRERATFHTAMGSLDSANFDKMEARQRKEESWDHQNRAFYLNIHGSLSAN